MSETLTPAVPFDAAAALAKLKSHEPNNYVNSEQSFHFRKDKTLGTKRPNVTLVVPVPSLAGLLNALENDKIQEYILDSMAENIFAAVREQLNDEENPVNSQADLDLSKLTLEYLANIPKADRRGSGISKELWEGFAKDYVTVMPTILKDRTEAQIANAAKIFVSRFAQVKTQKPVVSKLTEYLNMWFEATPNSEDFAEVYEWLTKKSAELLAIDPSKWQADI